jgi:DNA helicase IV
VANHPELDAEQAYIDHAYECLERTKRAVEAMRDTVQVGAGGTFQNRFERDVVHDRVEARLQQLELGDLSLVFGRIDTEGTEELGDGTEELGDGTEELGEGTEELGEGTEELGDGTGAGETYYIGRLAVADDRRDPVVVDWRAPVSEAFYRATGRDPMGLVRRRHFASRGRLLLGIDDELFGSATRALDQGRVQGYGALISALEESRSGRLSDIVATIQVEQDLIIRSELPGVLVVQGGPGTGKTVVALHRAAYLLYTHRFPLEGQGVLVVGPNRVFLSYIEQVLPSLGEAGVSIAVLADLVPHVRVAGYDTEDVARVKGDLRMIDVIAKAVRDRERPLRDPLRVPYGLQRLVVTTEDSAEIVSEARRRFRTHNAGRRLVEQLLFERLTASARTEESVEVVRERTRRDPLVREALERMWPVLTPTELLNDLFGSRALLRLAGGRRLADHEWSLLHRPRCPDPTDVVFTHHDVPLLDEALEKLGPRPRHKDDDAVRTYGHIVVDEAQDLSPMELRVLDRRSLNGSMTIVGDIAQATGAWAHDDWESVLEHLPARRPPRRTELSIGYRVPGPIMDLAARVLPLAAPDLRPPTSIRHTGDEPIITATTDDALDLEVVDAVRRELKAVGSGNVAVIAPSALVDRLDAFLTDAGVEHGRATRQGLDKQVTLVPTSLVKGLELDSVIVVEPAAILEDEVRGAQALYVSLTRSTKRLSILHTRPLPDVLRR